MMMMMMKTTKIPKLILVNKPKQNRFLDRFRTGCKDQIQVEGIVMLKECS